MKIITFKKPVQLELGYWKYIHRLFPGIPYVFFDNEAEKLGSGNNTFLTRPIENHPNPYQGEDLSGRSLLFISLGGYGDALSLLLALNALQIKYPDSRIDICTNMDIYWLMKQFNFKGGWLSYPLKLHYFKKYDYYQSSESINKAERPESKNISKLYHRILNVDQDLSASVLTLDNGARQAMSLHSDSRIKIAIQVDSGSGINKSYPVEYVYRLSEMLSESGYEVYFVGFGIRIHTKERENFYDYTDCTPTVVEFVALLSQMDGVIAPDSAGAHIGGILNIPTIALFSASSMENLTHYPSVRTISSEISCAPCLNLYKCPAGHDSCIAFHDKSTSPEYVFARVMEIFGDPL